MKCLAPNSLGYDIPFKVAKIKAQLLMEIEFGTPSKGCRNYGICNMSPLKVQHEIKPLADRKAKALITVYDKYNVEIDFFRHSITNSTFEEFFNRESFLIEESKAFVTQYGDFFIGKGSYPIQEDKNLIKVVFEENTSF